MIRLPLLAAGLALYFGIRLLSGRRGRRIVRLRDGRRVQLVSSVALLDGSAGNLLALEYLSPQADPAPEELRLEARSLVQTVGARSGYQGCRSAVVTVRRRDERSVAPSTGGLTFTFRRGDSGSDWYFTEGLE